MLNRREFLQTAALGLGALATPSRAAEPSIEINDTLKKIACALGASEHVEKVDMHLVENPSVGLVQWRWCHFRHDIDTSWLAIIEEVNRQLFDAMQPIFDMPDGGLNELMLEGLVEGYKGRNQIAEWQTMYRDYIIRTFTRHSFQHQHGIPPSEYRVGLEMKKLSNMTQLITQRFPTKKGYRFMRLSTLARHGAGFALSMQNSVTLTPAEDPDIDAKAEWAEQQEDPDIQKRWMIDERNTHFVNIVSAKKQKIVHLLVGCLHNLRSDVEAHNAQSDERIAHAVVSVKGLPPEDK
jgi:hypothetical protein